MESRGTTANTLLLVVSEQGQSSVFSGLTLPTRDKTTQKMFVKDSLWNSSWFVEISTASWLRTKAIEPKKKGVLSQKNTVVNDEVSTTHAKGLANTCKSYISKRTLKNRSRFENVEANHQLVVAAAATTHDE